MQEYKKIIITGLIIILGILWTVSAVASRPSNNANKRAEQTKLNYKKPLVIKRYPEDRLKEFYQHYFPVLTKTETPIIDAQNSSQGMRTSVGSVFPVLSMTSQQ